MFDTTLGLKLVFHRSREQECSPERTVVRLLVHTFTAGWVAAVASLTIARHPTCVKASIRIGLWATSFTAHFLLART